VAAAVQELSNTDEGWFVTRGSGGGIAAELDADMSRLNAVAAPPPTVVGVVADCADERENQSKKKQNVNDSRAKERQKQRQTLHGERCGVRKHDDAGEQQPAKGLARFCGHDYVRNVCHDVTEKNWKRP
jgi:hypothetical protein